MGLYIKKPIPVEAVKVERENRHQIISLLKKGVTDWEEIEDGFIVHSWEGVEPVKYGSNYWIIKGIKGECYPCEGSVFDASYEAKKDKDEKQTKHVKCTNCGKLIPFGSEVTIWKGYVGIFCTDECAYNYYASEFLVEARLNDRLADDQSVRVGVDL